MIRKKILLLGDFGVGKTSLIRRFVDNTFDDSYHTTIGVKVSRKQLQTKQIDCEFLIWDIEGATPMRSIPQSYYNGASGAIIVGDVTREETMQNTLFHQEQFYHINPDSPTVIAYNKADLVSNLTLQKWQNQSDFLPTSAKSSLNVEKLFYLLLERIFDATHQNHS